MGMAMGYAVLAGAAGSPPVGRSVEEVADAVRARCSAATVVFYVDTLEHLRRGGRIGKANALLGSALAIKPILGLADGSIVPLERVRTSSRAIARLEELAVEAARARQAVDVAVHHLDSAERAEKLAERLRSRIDGLENFMVVELGAVVGAHVGPGHPGHRGESAGLTRTRREPVRPRHGRRCRWSSRPSASPSAASTRPRSSVAARAWTSPRWGRATPVRPTSDGSLGRKWGIAVGVLDVLKGLVPTFVVLRTPGHLARARRGGGLRARPHLQPLPRRSRRQGGGDLARRDAGGGALGGARRRSSSSSSRCRSSGGSVTRRSSRSAFLVAIGVVLTVRAGTTVDRGVGVWLALVSLSSWPGTAATSPRGWGA